jgi:hypothetical protein
MMLKGMLKFVVTIEQDRQYKYMLRRVRVAIVAVEEQRLLAIMSACSMCNSTRFFNIF